MDQTKDSMSDYDRHTAEAERVLAQEESGEWAVPLEAFAKAQAHATLALAAATHARSA